MDKRIFEITSELGGMDDALVSEAVRAGAKPKKSRLPWLIAAAAVMIVIGAAVVLPKLLKPDAGDISAQLSTMAPEETEQVYASDATADPKNGDSVITSAPVNTTVEPVETPAHNTQSIVCTTFNSVPAVAMAVSYNRKTNDNAALQGLTGIFMPTKVPYGGELDGIEITSDMVTVHYRISDEYAHPIEEWEPDPNHFELIWYRNCVPGSAEALAGTIGDDEYIKYKDGIWIIRNLSNYLIDAVWEADGCVFGLVVPGYYCEDEDVLSFTGTTWVDLDNIDQHSPWEGFVIEGYMWIRDGEYGFSPVNSFAYGTTYCEPSNGNNGGMICADGLPFINGITNVMREFPHVGSRFEPVFLEDTTLGGITVYDVNTLEPIASNISLEELRDVAELNISQDMITHITRDCSGCVLVDMIAVHQKNYISELDEYEIEAYHCGFIIECGH